MSKIGKKLIQIPAGITVEVKDGKVLVKGPKGEIEKKLPDKIFVKIADGNVEVLRKDNTKLSLALHGTWRSIINNMIKGVMEYHQKSLELVGTGFRAEVSGDTLTLMVGYSHPVKIKSPAGISFKVEKNLISVSGIDKEKVGEIAAKIRAVRPPEPYKGKGIKYVDEILRRKPGKAAAKATGGTA